MCTQPKLEDPLPPPPRPRVSLRTAMRQQGIDEHKIAYVLNEQVDRLRLTNSKENRKHKKSAAEEKMILDSVKECVKIIDPAARAGAALDQVVLPLTHQVARPESDPISSNGRSAIAADLEQ